MQFNIYRISKQGVFGQAQTRQSMHCRQNRRIELEKGIKLNIRPLALLVRVHLRIFTVGTVASTEL